MSRFADRAGEVAGQFLAQFDAPLVEGIDPPNHALDENLVLVQRQECAEGVRVEGRLPG